MNSNKKSTPASGVPQPLNRQAGSARQLKPLVAQQPVPRVLQTKSSQSRQAGQASHLPVAPPRYRPEAKKIVQPKTISQPGKLPTAPPVYRPKLNILPKMASVITAKRTASSFSAVQMAKAVAHECSAKVVSNGGQEYSGEYTDVHAEINALEKYFAAGGDVAGIKRIELSSKPCKYCHIILSDLGIRDKVLLTREDPRKYGNCMGGSYGWFARGGNVWNAIRAATGAADEDKYADTVSERRKSL